MPYASIQAIREGAGLLPRSDNETPAGDRDGSNKDFTTKRRPIVDSDYDDEVTTADVQAFVGGVSVPVASVDAANGVITLETAPAANTKVTVTYRFSPITDDYVAGKQAEADDWVDRKLKSAVLNTPPTLPLNPVPGTITTAAELYAAGLILTRDGGASSDTQQTSKDGFAKIKLAGQILADYITGLQADEKNAATSTGGSRQMSGISDGDTFSRTYPDDIYYCSPDDWFMRRQC